MEQGLKKSQTRTDGIKKESAVQSIRRAAEILNCISNGVNSVTNIAKKCGLSKSTTHRLLKALSESEMVMQDTANRQYFLGYAIIKLISTPLTTQEYLTSCASEEMNLLSESTGESVSLGIKMGVNSIVIHVVTSKSELKVEGTNFKIKPIHIGVDGSVLLSQLDDYQVSNIVDNLRYELDAKSSRVSPEDLIKKVQMARRLGYAVGNDELNLGVTCISAPIRNYALPTVLNLVGPEIRMRNRMQTLINAVKECAEKISLKLSRQSDTGSPRL